jgi:hypothetical protein
MNGYLKGGVRQIELIIWINNTSKEYNIKWNTE